MVSMESFQTPTRHTSWPTPMSTEKTTSMRRLPKRSLSTPPSRGSTQLGMEYTV